MALLILSSMCLPPNSVHVCCSSDCSLTCCTHRKAKALVSKVVEDAGGVASLPMPFVSCLLSIPSL